MAAHLAAHRKTKYIYYIIIIVRYIPNSIKDHKLHKKYTHTKEEKLICLYTFKTTNFISFSYPIIYINII